MNKCIKCLGILIILMAFAATAMAADPTINDITLNTDTPEPEGTIVVEVNATDNDEVDSVFANDVSLSQVGGGDIWEGTITAEAVGTHHVNVVAKNSTGHVTWHNSTEYTSTDTIAPVVNSVKLNTYTPEPEGTIVVEVNATDNDEVDSVFANDVSLSQVGGGDIWRGDVTAETMVGTYYVNVSAEDSSGKVGWNNLTSYTSTTTPSGGSPVINPVKPSANPKSEVNKKMTFEIKVNQTVTIIWYINGTEVNHTSNVPSSTSNIYENNTAPEGVYNVTVHVENMTTQREASYKWIWTVTARGYSTGNRIWEDGMDTTYHWTAQTFTGFYYDIDDDLSTETLTITDIRRSLGEEKIEYVTTPRNVTFDRSSWGTYNVVGFMAEKYFAGYVSGDVDRDITDDTISLVSNKMLSKVLIDEDDKHMVSTGASLELKEGYEIKIIQLDLQGDKAQIELLRDGKSMDTGIIDGATTYTYTRDIGSVDDVPVVVIRVDSVFAGTESDMLVIKGIFQISENYKSIKTGETYGEMEITGVGGSGITMKNDDDVSLDEGEIVDLMGDIKFLVADSGTLRFALYKEITTPGTYDIRGTVYDTTETPTWDPMNFEGFYYNIDDALGTEELTVEDIDDTSIGDGDLVYKTTVQSVKFDCGDWGEYNVIGFMAEKYFAGYNSETNKYITDESTSLVSHKLLSKILIDTDKKRMVSTGASLELEEGYELKVIQLDRQGDKAQIELLRNGKSVDTGIISKTPATYAYKKELGKVDDVPVVVIRVDSVFAGTESDMLVIKGVFQISENCKSIENGDKYGEMEIKSTLSNEITMINDDDISLNEGGNTMIMGDIGIMTSEHGERYALFVRRTVGSIAALKIELPERLIIGEEIVIKVTADGSPVEGAEVQFAGENLGLTDSDGKIRITSEEAGTFTIIASKENYDSASMELRILTEAEADMDPLEIGMQDTAEPGDDVIIKVTYKGDAIENASITWDGTYIGKTDETGSLTYTAEDEGTYTVTANKDGYLEGSEAIEVAVPSAKFELTEFTIPAEVSANKNFAVSVDVTNTGDDSGTYLAELKVNDSVVDSQNVTLDTGETEKIEFTTKIAEAGTTTIEIGTESGEITVTKSKSNTTLIAVILIVLALLGAIGYLLISSAPEGGWTVGRLSDAIKDKFQRGGKGL